MNKHLEKLQEIYEFIFDSPLIAVAEFLCFLFTLVASLYFLVTGVADVLLPRLGWLGIFLFMLVGGVEALNNIVQPDMLPEDAEEFGDEDDEGDDEEGEDT